MKQEYDKEMDSLLRRSARLAAAGQRDAGRARVAAPAHLDADELSAFAENALPAPARLAAATHLADCDECRGLVVSLSSASGAAAEIERSAAAVTTSAADASVAAAASGTAAAPVAPAKARWWQTLFAPRVLRYVAPVLVLGLVGVVSLIALRPWQGAVPGGVYQRDEVRDAAPSTTSANTAPADTSAATGAGQDSGPPVNANTTNGSNAPSGVPGGLVAPSASMPEAQPTVVAPAAPVVLDGVTAADKAASPADAGADLAAAKKAGPSGEAARENKQKETTAENVVVQSEPAPPPAATKSAGTEAAEQPKGARGAETARRNEAEGYVLNDRAQVEPNRAGQSRARNQQEVQMPDGGSQRGESRAMNNSQRGNLGGGYPSNTTTRSERAPASRRGRSDDAKARDSAAEDDETVRVESTRSVAGRRFRREGSAWVDVNYKSSMSMTAVRRGTEGYRALVADIPELRRIAEQLGGEVIAVVKGRAYRIR